MKIDIKIKSLIMFSMIIMLFGNFLFYINVLDRTASTTITYFFILFPAIVGIIPICKVLINKKYKFKYIHELNTGIFIFVVFLIISLIKSHQVGVFTVGTIGELVRIFIPFFYTFIAINFLSKSDIRFFVKLALLVAWISFLLELNFSSISFNDIKAISFVNSYSPFENSAVSLLSYALSIYFIYYWKKMPVWTFFSVLLVFLTFKRVYILTEICLLIIVLLKKQNIKINNFIMYVSSFFWIGAVKIYMFMLQPQNYNWDLEKLHFDVASFSMFRAYRVWFLIQHNFTSYGLGSTTKELQIGWLRGATLELDFIKILMELGLIGIIIFIFSYYRLTRNNFYSYVVMSFTFLQLLMANGLTGYLEWAIILTTIALINYDKINDNIDSKIYWPFIHLKEYGKDK